MDILSLLRNSSGAQAWLAQQAPSTGLSALGLSPREMLDREMSYDGSHPRQQEQAARDHFRSYGPQTLADAFIPGYGAGGDAKAASEAYGEGRYGAAALNAGMAAADFLPFLSVLPAAAKGIRAFHASPYDIDEFKPSNFRGSTFFAATPEGAQAGAGAGAREFTMDFAGVDGPAPKRKIYEVEIDADRIAGLSLTPAEREVFASLPSQVMGDAAIEKVQADLPAGLSWDMFYDAVKVGDREYVYKKRPAAPALSYEDAVKSGRDVYGKQWPHYAPDGDEAKSARRARDAGMSGYLVYDEGGLSIAVSDPAAVKMVRPSGGAAAKGIRAFHGSPHDFDRFDMSKIGTGEGAQAYGHGLYFAENEGVARGYRDALSGPKYQYKGQEIDFGISTSDPLAVALDRIVGRIDRGMTPSDAQALAVRDLEESAARAGGGKLEETYRNAASAARGIDTTAIGPVSQGGRMYEVNINADPEAFLDWDKPLSEQPGTFREYVGERGYPEQRLQDTMTNLDLREGRVNLSGFSPERTKDLRDAGIPGIKYLDAGSRGAGDGSRNYVVFDDRLITILRKYGIGGLIAGGGAYALTDAEYAQAAELLAQDGMNTGAQ